MNEEKSEEQPSDNRLCGQAEDGSDNQQWSLPSRVLNAKNLP